VRERTHASFYLAALALGAQSGEREKRGGRGGGKRKRERGGEGGNERETKERDREEGGGGEREEGMQRQSARIHEREIQNWAHRLVTRYVYAIP